jgi:hypothetical protein
MDEQQRAELAAALADVITIWAAPALIDDSAEPDRGPLPVLMVLPSILAQTIDQSDDATDVLTSSLLGYGFTLLSRLDPDQILDATTPQGWSVVLDPDDQHLRIDGPAGALYDGDLGPQPPLGWQQAARRRRELAVLVASTPDAHIDDLGDQFAAAAAAARLVGARIPLHEASIHH